MTQTSATLAPSRKAALMVALLGGVLALSACDNQDNKTAGEKLDDAVARTERAAEEAAAKTRDMAADAKAKMDSSTAATDTKNAITDAGNAVANAATDVSITAAVNAGLAKDPDLSAIKIDVDTSAGKVTLSGPAPSEAAKSRAEEIAKGVSGVSSVDNRLEVKM